MNLIQRPCSSVDRALASEARSGSSSLPRDAIIFKTLIFLLIINLLLTSCIPFRIVPPAPWQDWVIDDVLWLSPDPINQNGLIAIYFRQAESSCQFRFDLLDYSSLDIFDLQISLFLKSTVLNPLNPADYTLSLPANSDAFLLGGNGQQISTQGIQVYRSPALDGIVVQLVNGEICAASGFTFQAELKHTDGSVMDITPLISSIASPPNPAYLLLAFWNTLPASTPIQLLRRWDGAHTGPFGQRHGLRILAEAAEEYQVPIFLLDLKQPESLAGLELLGQTTWIRQLQQNHVVYLPDSTWGSTLAKGNALALAQQTTKAYNFQISQLYFTPEGSPSPTHDGYFSFTQNPAPIYSNSTLRIFPLPYSPDQSPPEWITQAATLNGLSEFAMKTLLSNAITADGEKLLVLGGNLPTSPLADQTIAEPVMAYISAHPWIHVVTSDDLMSLSAELLNEAPEKVSSQPSNVEEEVFLALMDSPNNEFSASAWEMFLHLSKVSDQDPSYSISQRYLPQIYNLLEGSNWAEQPKDQNDCNFDLDADGFRECILSNRTTFLILDPLGARIEFAAGANPSGSFSQIIGTTAQLSIGLSDPALWSQAKPYNPDPDVIPGALDDQGVIPLLYTVDQKPGSISFTTPGHETTKTFTLFLGGFQIQVNTLHPQEFTIPLIVEPNIRNYSTWPAQFKFTQVSYDRFTWGVRDDFIIEANISGAEYDFSNIDSLIPSIQKPENPDQTYPSLFFKPYPLAMIQISPSRNWAARFRFQ